MRAFLSFLLLIHVFGCGSDRVPVYPVSGRVEFEDGQPVRNGTIELESVSFGTTANGRIQHDGSFVLGTYAAEDGAAAGKHQVIIVQIIVADGSITHTQDHGQPVPVRFGSYDTSPLSVEVKAEPANHLVITLPTNESQQTSSKR